MQVEYAFVADSAEYVGGKLYVLGGGIRVLRAQTFPAVHAHMAFVLSLSVHPAECEREHHLEIELWGPDGERTALRLGGQFTAQRDPEDPTVPTMVQIVLNIAGLAFPRPGPYEFHVLVDGSHIKAVPIRLVEDKRPDHSLPEENRG